MPGFTVPPGACDCHMHIFGDNATYPPAAIRAYTPTPMRLDRYRLEAARLGLSRVVIVQPSAYGSDNRCTLDALRADPARTRAIAVIDDATSQAELAAMAAIGVKGIRLNLISNAAPAPDEAIAALRRAAERVGPYGMHIQIFAMPDLIAALAPSIRTLGVLVVVDHMGATDGGLAERRPGFDAVLDLLAAGRIWVKLSGANRVSRTGGDFRDALPVMRALIAANPGNLVWGTDWPHIGPHAPGEMHEVVYMGYDNLALLRLLGEAANDDALASRILATNPALLYGFPNVLP